MREGGETSDNRAREMIPVPWRRRGGKQRVFFYFFYFYHKLIYIIRNSVGCPRELSSVGRDIA